MLRPFRIWFLFTCVAGLCTQAQPLPQPKEYRILLLLNGGHSMLATWSSHETRYQLASRIINTLTDSMYGINDQVAFGLNVYGHLYTQAFNKCDDNRQEVAFNKDNRAQINLRLQDLKPKGTASLSYAVKKAAGNNLSDSGHYYYSVLIITDSSDHCRDHICSLTKELLDKNVNFKTYIITIGDNEISKRYNCLGESLPVNAEKDIIPTIEYIISNYKIFLPIQQREVISVRKNKVAENTVTYQHQPKVEKDSVIKLEIAKQEAPKVSHNGNIRIESLTVEKNNHFGYLQFKNSYNDSFFVYYCQNGKYTIVDHTSSIIRTAGYKIKLNEGKYKIIYGNREKSFRVVKNMITDLWLN